MEGRQEPLWGTGPPRPDSGSGNVWVFASGKVDLMQLPIAVVDALGPRGEAVELIQIAPRLTTGIDRNRVQLLEATQHHEVYAQLPELRQRAEAADTIFVGTWTVGLIYGFDGDLDRDATTLRAASDLIAGVVGVLPAGPTQRLVEDFDENLNRFVRPCLQTSKPFIMCVVERPSRENPSVRLASPAVARVPGRNDETLQTIEDLAAYIAQSPG